MCIIFISGSLGNWLNCRDLLAQQKYMRNVLKILRFFIYDRVFDFLLMFLRNKWTLIWRKKQKVSFTCCNLYDNLYLHQFLFYINKGLKKKLFFPMFFFIFFLCSCPIVMIIFHDFCILDKEMVRAAE